MKKNETVSYHLAQLQHLGSATQAAILSRFFKTGPGEYGEGDLFLGIKTPVIRQYEREHRPWNTAVLHELLNRPEHEARSLALIALTHLYKKAGKDTAEKQALFQFYIDHFPRINNWDLVDISCPHIIGEHLLNIQPEKESLLYQWAESEDLWIKRISVVSTLTFIHSSHFEPTLNLCAKLLRDTHDLIHKATGWMLREVGKKDESILLAFLDTYVSEMPRTTLRYALERMPASVRSDYMSRPSLYGRQIKSRN